MISWDIISNSGQCRQITVWRSVFFVT